VSTPEPPDTSTEAERKPEIGLFEGDLAGAVDEIEALLVKHDRQIYQCDGKLYVRLEGRTVLATAALLRIRAMRPAIFYAVRLHPRYATRRVDPPLKIFEALRQKGEWKFPPLDDGTGEAQV
jgi:hypothetical protein